MPPAPGTFSTTKGLPNVVVNFSASRRASTSGLPPGPDGRDQPHRVGGPGLVLRQRGAGQGERERQRENREYVRI